MLPDHTFPSSLREVSHLLLENPRPLFLLTNANTLS